MEDYARLFVMQNQVDAQALSNIDMNYKTFEFDDTFFEKHFDEFVNYCKEHYDYVYLAYYDDDMRNTVAENLLRNGVSPCVIQVQANNPLHLRLQGKTIDDFEKIVKTATVYLEEAITDLPTSFTMAKPIIEGNLAFMLNELDTELRSHYIGMIAKKTKSKIPAINTLIANAISNHVDDIQQDRDIEFSPEEIEKAKEIAMDPQLFMKRIDAVNQAGVVGERRNIALLFCTLDSRLIKDDKVSGQSSINVKIAGPQGSGKTFSFSVTRSHYPKSRYVEISSASKRSLYYLGDIKHKCIIFDEAFQLKEDKDIAYIIRLLLSEGKATHKVTTKNSSGAHSTKTIELVGPVSLITTTIDSDLEQQLDDRIFTIHPDISLKQTKNIIKAEGLKHSGFQGPVPFGGTAPWQAFHQSLQPESVIIPYAERMAEFVNLFQLPIAARRAFTRVLNVIKAITIAYQFQRERDDNNNLISTYEDFHMAWQVLNEIYQEDLGGSSKIDSDRLNFIEANGPVTQKTLVDKFSVSKNAISKFVIKNVEDGVLEWVDSKGNPFSSDSARESAKKAGKAFIMISTQLTVPKEEFRLLTVHELSRDRSWDEGEDKYEYYNLNLDEEEEEESLI